MTLECHTMEHDRHCFQFRGNFFHVEFFMSTSFSTEYLCWIVIKLIECKKQAIKQKNKLLLFYLSAKCLVLRHQALQYETIENHDTQLSLAK